MSTWTQRVTEIKARLRAASGPGSSGAEYEDTHEERWDGRVIIGEGWWESDIEYPNERADAVFLTHAYDDIADLLSENERLRSECAVITDDMIERAARGISAHWHDMTTNGSLDRERSLARAALESALNTKEN